MAREAEDRIERLELEIKEIKDALAGGPRRKIEDLSSDDVQAYLKVRDLLVADYGEFCGINDCFRCIAICRVCQVCSVCRVCQACIFECNCGPCNLGGGFQGGISRFRDLGG